METGYSLGRKVRYITDHSNAGARLAAPLLNGGSPAPPLAARIQKVELVLQIKQGLFFSYT